MGASWGRIKSTKSLISGENIDEPYRAGLIHSPKGFLYVFQIIITLDYFDELALYLPSDAVLMCKIFFIFASTNPFLINPEREQVQSR